MRMTKQTETSGFTGTGHPLTLTQEELLALLQERFGTDPMAWAFQCPTCGDIATGQDFKEALTASPRTRTNGSSVTASALLGQECIGRTLGALRGPADDWKGRGCDWTAYGLFHGPVTITVSGGDAMHAFPVAPAH